MNKILLLSIFSLLLVSFAFADSMWYDFTNDYATDGNAKFNVFVDADGDGLPDAGYDVNITMTVGNQDFIFQETTGNDGYAQFNFDFNHNGVLGKDGNEFQFEILDVDSNKSETMDFYQPSFKDIDLNWQVDKVLDIETDQNIVFNSVFYDENGNVDSGFDGNFKMYLFDPNGNFVADYNVFSDSNIVIPYVDFNSEAGKYQVMIGGQDGDENLAGYKTFTFDVKSFNLTAYAQTADMEESKGSFGSNEALELVAFATDLNGDIVDLNKLYYKIDNEDFVDVNSLDTKTTVENLFDSLSEGSHKVEIIGTIGDYNQSIDLSFNTLDYESEALMKKNDNAGTKERFSGAYAPDGNATFFFGVKDFGVNDYITFTESDCNALLSGIEYSKPGFKSKSDLQDFDVNYNSTQNMCEVTFTAPTTEGEYIYTLDLNEDFNATYGSNLDAELKLDVQKYNLFLDPIDPSSAIDETTGEVDKKADKFEFFDENVGFVVNVVNLSDGTTGQDLNVEDISQLQIVDNGVAYTLEANEGDFDYNYETKLLIINKDAEEMQNVSGGFEVQATFDTNSDKTELIKSYGASKKKTFKISVDLNMTAYDGPPYVTPDENAVLVVTATNSSDSALDYVNVNVTRIFNFETMQEIDLSTLNGYTASGSASTVDNITAITDSTGIAYINLGSELDTGMYEITVDVNDGTLSDEGIGFFMIRNFFAFGFPGDAQQGGAFLENGYLGRNDPIEIATFVFSGTGFMDSEFADTSLYSIPTGTAKLFFETDDGTGRKQIVADVNYAGYDVNWTKGSVVDPGKIALITPSAALVPGMYEAMYDVNYNGTVDTAITRFTIQGFGVQVCNYRTDGQPGVSCGESMMGEGPMGDNVASPDSNILFVLNGNSSGEATLHISLIDEKSFSTVSGADDMNYYLNGVLEIDKQFNVNSNAQDQNPSNDQNIIIALPSNVPLGEYEVLFDFVKAGIHTKYSRYITIKQFEIIIPTDMRGMRSAMYVEDWTNGGIDTNILNTEEWWTDQLCGDGNTFDVTGIDYNAFYVPGMTGTGDINYPLLVDLDNYFIYIDSDWDCNFVNDLNYISGDKNAHSELMNDGNSVMFTSITLQGIKHILIPTDTESSSSDMQNNFVGEYDVGRNFVIPLVITNTSGDPYPDVNVIVNKVKKVDFINGTMETLTSGYTVVNDNNTDENGVVFIKMNVQKTGEYQLELIIASPDGKREKLMPWEGPVFQIKKINSEFGFVSSERANNQLITVDLNSNAQANLSDIDQSIAFYGDYNEAVYGDIDGNIDVNKTYYIIYDSTYGNRFNIDDDTNFGEQNGSESYGMKRTDFGATWPTCLGDYNANAVGQQNDCVNSNAIMVANSEDYELEINLLDYQGIDWSFEVVGPPTGWSTTGLASGTDLNAVDGNRSAVIPGTTNISFSTPITISEQFEIYDLNYCAFGSEAIDQNIQFYYYYGSGPEDGNIYYNFDTNNWDENISDLNIDYYLTNSLTTDWNCFNRDFNVGGMSQININFIQDGNADHNYIVDAVTLNGTLTTHRLSFYNRTSYRQLPSDLKAEVSDEFKEGYMMWANSNISDTNHYMEVSFKDRLRNDMNIVDANVTATLLRRGTCAMMNGPMQMTYLGKLTSTRISNVDSWVFNFGDLGSGLTPEDSTCQMYDMKIDISANIGGTVYEDSAWNNFFIRNNEPA